MIPFPIRFVIGEAEEGERKFWEREGDILFHPSFSLLVDVLRRASFLIGNDSGVTHLSAYLGTPTLALFGPTSPFIWAPRGRRVKVIYHPLPCSPCSEGCEEKRCLRLVTPEEILKALWDILEEGKDEGKN